MFNSLYEKILGRAIIRTKHSYIGLNTETKKKDNAIASLEDGKLSLVTWKISENEMMVGDCYIHDMMNGEAFDNEK